MEENILKDKTLICKDCRRKFTFTVKEQMDWGQKGWSDPVRCKYCQRQKAIRLALLDGVKVSDEIRFSEICDKCHRSFYTKIKRKMGFNLYCDDCWNEIKRAKPDEKDRKEDSGVADGKA
jgi:hypothetical protein